MSKVKVKYGDRYGKLTIIKEVQQVGYVRRFLCSCDCGNEKIIRLPNLRNGHTKSCGCYLTEVNSTHGMTKSKTHNSWTKMKQRCLNQNDLNYHNYGGRGIKVCKRWLKFENFLEDMGERPVGMTLDRIDVNGNYEKNNCKWSTLTDQLNNTRRNCIFNGETAVQASRRLGGDDGLVASRIYEGWNKKEAFTTKIKIRKRDNYGRFYFV